MTSSKGNDKGSLDNRGKVKSLINVEVAQIMGKIGGRTRSLGKFPLFRAKDVDDVLERIDQIVDLIFESIEEHQQTKKKG